MAVTAAMVKDLRERTGAGMMDCKTALGETAGDMEQAIDWLRKKGLSKAAKKSGRVAAEGLVAVAVGPKAGAVVEVNSETDFVARNAQFQEMVGAIAGVSLAHGGDLEKTKAATYPGAALPITEYVNQMIATIGENMNLRRTAGLTVSQGVVSAYTHAAVVPGAGKIGVLVALESAGDAAKLEALGKQIAMHVAAANPVAMTSKEVDSSLLEREKAVLIEQAKASGKPDSVVEKMVEGRIRKFYEEVCLVEQAFVVNPDVTVGKAVEALAKELGTPVTLKGFVRFAIGEGIEKEKSDFAAEVAAAVNG